MRTLFSLGPFETEDGRSHHLCFSFTPGREPESEGGATVLDALRKLEKRGLTRGAVCDEAMAKEAAALGLATAPLSDDLIALKAGLAVMLEHGGALSNPELVLELIEAASDFDELAPWEVFRSGVAIELELKGLPSAGRPCEATVMGSGDDEFGLTLFYQRGTVEEVQRLIEQDRVAEARAYQGLMLFLDEEPAAIASAVEAFTGAALVPHLLYVRRGAPERPREEDVAVLIAALDAVVMLAEGEEEGVGHCDHFPKLEVIARIRPAGAALEKAAPVALQKVGRNDPCPCGSGKKFKRCHAGAEGASTGAAPATEANAGVSPWHAVDARLKDKVIDHAVERLGVDKGMDAARALHGDREPSPELVIPWSLYEYPVDGARSAGAMLLAEKASVLDAKERTLLDAQLAARVSVLEVLEVRPNEGLRLHDLFSGEVFFATEKAMSRSVLPRTIVVGRIVHVDGEHLVGGVHRAALPPRQAEEVLEAFGGGISFGQPPGPPPPAPALVRRWDDAVSALALKLASPMVMTNTDGEPLLFIEETFSVKKGARDELVDRLAGLEHASIDKDSASTVELTFTRPGNALHTAWKRTVIGTAKVNKASMVLSTNSEARAAALRARIEAVAGHLLTFKGRKESKPPESRGGEALSFDVQPMGMGEGSEPEALRAALAHQWLDEPIPELGGQTPRAAVADPALRWKVHRMVCDVEYMESRAEDSPGARDLGVLRKELGLTETGATLPHHDLHLALGMGRKLSACVLDIAQPLLATAGKLTKARMEQVMELAAGIWNAAVVDAKENRGEVARMRGQLLRGGLPTAPFESALELRNRRHARDLRMVGNWEVSTAQGGFSFFCETRVDSELADRAHNAGIVPPR